MASVLETFFFEFKGETRDAEAALSRIEKKADGAERELGKVGTSFAKLAGGIAGAVGGFMAFNFLANGIEQTADQMNRLNESAGRLGMDVGDLDAWTKGIEDAGGSAEAFQGSLKGLAGAIQMAKVKGKSRATPFFEEMGIDEKKVKDVTELLPQLAEKFEQMSEQEALGFGQKLGIDEYTVGVLQKGRKATEEMIAAQKRLGVVSKQDAETIAAYDDAMDNLGRVFQNVWRLLTVAVVPAITEVAQEFTDFFIWSKEHGPMLGAFVLVFAGIMTAVFLPTIWAGVSALMTMAGAWLAAFWPVVAIIALVAALSAAIALLWEDFQVWVEGGDSWLGRHLGTWQNFHDQVVGWIDSLKQKWDDFWADLSGKWDKMKEIGVDLKNSASDWLENPLDQTQKLGAGVVQAFEAGNAAMQVAGETPLNAQGAATTNNSKQQSVVVQTGPVTVETAATDAGGVAEGLSDKLSAMMRDAVAMFDDGVEA